MSSILEFLQRLHAMKARAAQLQSHSVRLGWTGTVREKERTKPKAEILSSKKKGKRSKISNFDMEYIGPGQHAASYAVIAKTLCYGRAGGVTNDGHEYGAIPARNFVEVMQRKHLKPLHKDIIRTVIDRNNPSPDVDLKRIGVIAKGQLQRAMRDSNEYDKNAPITIKGGWMANVKNKKPFYIEPKKTARPLIDTGNLIRSVDFEID